MTTAQLKEELKKGIEGELFYIKGKVMKFSSFRAVDSYCKENNIKNWSMVGMRSMAEMIADSKLPVIR